MGYLIAAYVVGVGGLVGYLLWLVRERRALARELSDAGSR